MAFGDLEESEGCAARRFFALFPGADGFGADVECLGEDGLREFGGATDFPDASRCVVWDGGGGGLPGGDEAACDFDAGEFAAFERYRFFEATENPGFDGGGRDVGALGWCFSCHRYASGANCLIHVMISALPAAVRSSLSPLA
jgi:hypothetical protein